MLCLPGQIKQNKKLNSLFAEGKETIEDQQLNTTKKNPNKQNPEAQVLTHT